MTKNLEIKFCIRSSIYVMKVALRYPSEKKMNYHRSLGSYRVFDSSL